MSKIYILIWQTAMNIKSCQLKRYFLKDTRCSTEHIFTINWVWTKKIKDSQEKLVFFKVIVLQKKINK